MKERKSVGTWIFFGICIFCALGFLATDSLPGFFLMLAVSVAALPVAKISNLWNRLLGRKIKTVVFAAVFLLAFSVGSVTMESESAPDDSVSYGSSSAGSSINTVLGAENPETENEADESVTSESETSAELTTTEAATVAETTMVQETTTEVQTTTEKKTEAETTAKKTETTTTEKTTEAGDAGSGTTYILNTNSHKFHYPDCYSAARISEKNREEYTGDREDLIAQGYEPCKNCNP